MDEFLQGKSTSAGQKASGTPNESILVTTVPPPVFSLSAHLPNINSAC